LIIKLLIIISIVISGFVLLYPEEIIQFSKGSTIQESTEKNLMDLKDGIDNETTNIKQILSEFSDKAQTNFNNFFQ
jgi:hypothetical protein